MKKSKQPEAQPEAQPKKVLSGVNLTHKRFGMQRYRFGKGNYDSATSMIGNFRKLIHNLGYDCSLLADNEILALEDLIHDYESEGDDTLIEALDFMSN